MKTKPGTTAGLLFALNDSRIGYLTGYCPVALQGPIRMRPARHRYLVEKATQAAVASIEVYNKPGFKYREETFAILMLNAWELLLKARILKENKNKLRSIEVWDSKASVGENSKKTRAKKEPGGKQHDSQRVRRGANCTSLSKNFG
jgi:hypothetical protein